MNKKSKAYFTTQLMRWHETENQRQLPWKNENDPYKIWLSEIILQQTRAEQGLPYYNAFIKKYPSVKHLAKARDEEVFRMWQGLGYYNRCKNLLFTARYIANELKGKFPATYDDLLKLRGVGAYTAAAIASFAYGLPHAVVDGNVYRVLSRHFGIDAAYDTIAGKKLFASLAGELLFAPDSAAYNQAIMDMGATVCTPQSPDCQNCSLAAGCLAFKQHLVHLLPVKSKKTAIQKRYFHYVLLRAGDEIWIRKRTAKDIWQNLYELYLIELTEGQNDTGIHKHPQLKHFAGDSPLIYEGDFHQKLTHRHIHTSFYTLNIANKNITGDLDGAWVRITTLKNFGFPKTILHFLEKKLYF